MREICGKLLQEQQKTKKAFYSISTISIILFINQIELP
jgi:hypothetical protein